MTPRPRLLVVTPDFPPALGGIQTLLGEIVKRLRHVEAKVVTLRSPGWRDFDALNDVPTVRSPRVARAHRASVAGLNGRALAAALAWRPSVVLSGHAVLVPATAAVHRLLRTPVLQYVHANEFESRPGLSSRAVTGAARTVAVSSFTRELAIGAGADPARVHVVHPGVASPPPRSSAKASRPTILTIARLNEANKGHDVILDALPAIRDRVPDVEWVVVGDGPLRAALEERAAVAGLAGSVRFAGAVSDAERDQWLDRAHVFVLPSRPRASGGGGEGFGIVYLEAAAHGLPVVAGAVGGAVDAVAHGRTGILVDPERPAEVAAAVAQLLCDEAKREEFGAAGAARAATFTWPEIARRVEELVLDLASRR